MSGFRKAKAQQAALKIGMYGPPGSGKTFTSLLIAEGLSRLSRKRIAYVDTEHGTDFYCQTVEKRSVHPQAFEFDALYTRSITEIINSMRSLSESEYGVLVIDSITHVWEAAREAYNGRLNKAGQIPFHAWGKIKKPYKEIISMMLSTKMHVILCGRQGNEYGEDEETGELKNIGLKMKAEGETPYEPHILIRMEQLRGKPNEISKIVAYVEKDRTGMLNGHSFINPTFDDIGKPMLGLLGAEQANIGTLDTNAARDAEALAEQDREREIESKALERMYSAKIDLAKTIGELKKIGNELTPQVKAKMLPVDIATLRAKYLSKDEVLPKEPQQAPQPPPEAEKQSSPAELSKEKQVLVEIARAFYGESNFMREISKLCRNRGTDFATATDGQCKSMIQEINFEADKAAMG